MNLFAFALASTLACQPVLNDDLPGLWESASISKGGIGHNIEFRQDGAFIAAVTVLVDLRYEVKDGKLYTGKKPGEPVSYDSGTDIKIKHDGLTLTGLDGKPYFRNRISPDSDSSIVGIYKYRHNTGATVYEFYTADGIMHFRLPMQATQGCYTLDGTDIKLTRPGQEPQRLQYNVGPETLTLDDRDIQTVYNRVIEGSWYNSSDIGDKRPQE